MSSVITTAQQEFRFTITLTEQQARALNALFGYGADSLWDEAKKLGTHYMMVATENKPLPVLREIDSIVRKELLFQLSRADAARKAFAEGTST